MKTSSAWVVLSAFGLLCLAATSVRAQTFQPRAFQSESREAAVVDAATLVLDQIMATPAKGIPRALLADAQGIAIVPGLIKGGFVVGVRHGRGVVVVRDDQKRWQPPMFVTINGGSVGWQAGIQATDVVLVFKTPESVKGLMNGKFTIGGDVSAAAGPVGREAALATDAALKAEIYSYSRSRGLFAGASLDGSAMEIDSNAGAAFYQGMGAAAPGAQREQPARLPAPAERLLTQIQKYVEDAPGDGPPAQIAPQLAPGGPGPTEEQAARRQLADSAKKLSSMLDDNWRAYLALPVEIYGGERPPAAEAVRASLDRFNNVATDPKYRNLAQRREFQETGSLLKKYSELQAPTDGARLSLPPPPR